VKKSLGARTLLYPTPVLVVGSYAADGRPNVMTAAWGGIACSKPPCISVSLRAATATHGNIVARKAFTISLPGRRQAAQADYFGLVSGRDTDKFAAAGLTPVAGRVRRRALRGESFRFVIECAVVQVPRTRSAHPVHRRDQGRQGRRGLPGHGGQHRDPQARPDCIRPRGCDGRVLRARRVNRPCVFDR
jgi:flavin reductase (DIM6/NTAB) family NADH-FMN oxidoreductase RutF